MSRCAVCLAELRPGEQYGLEDEFVIHRRCVGLPIAIRVAAVEAQRELQTARAQLETVRRIKNEAKLTQELAGERAAMHTKLGKMSTDLLLAHEDVADLRTQLRAKERELAAEKNARALAELQARTTQPPAAQVSGDAEGTAPEQISNEPIDATRERFRLLELD